MIFVGLILPLCYVAGWTGATIPTQWAVLSVALLPALWQRCEVSSLHWLGLIFVAFAAASLWWTPDISLGIWFVAIWALAFWYGSTAPDLVSLWRGLALGLSVNSAVAIFQWFGYQPVPAEGAAGLLYNPRLLGACCALVLIALACHRQWVYMPGLLPGLLLSQSRGALAALALALAARLHWALVLMVVGVGAALVVLGQAQPDLMRLHFWTVAANNLSLLGNGVGSFNVVHVAYRGAVVRAENVHNDYLQLAFEFGFMAVVPIGVLAAALWRRTARDWPVLVGFAALGTFYFPLWSAIPAFIGCVVAGHILRDHDPLRGMFDCRRSGLLSWFPGAECRNGPARGRDISSFERFAAAREISVLTVASKESIR